MEKKEFNSRLRDFISTAKENFSGAKFEAVNNWFGTPVNVFQYSATSEHYMERQLNDCGKERKTTFMSDLSTGEWFGLKGVLDTVKNAISSWRDDEEYMADLSFVAIGRHGNMTLARIRTGQSFGLLCTNSLETSCMTITKVTKKKLVTFGSILINPIFY